MQRRAEKAWKRRQKGTVTPQLAPMNLKRAVWPEQVKDAKNIKNDAKKSTNRNLNPPACSGVVEKSMAEPARRKEAKKKR